MIDHTNVILMLRLVSIVHECALVLTEPPPAPTGPCRLPPDSLPSFLVQFVKDPEPIVADSCIVALDMLEHEQSGALEYCVM